MLGPAVEVLPGGKQTFHEKAGFHEIAAIIESVENRQRLSGIAVHEVRPDTVIPGRFFQKRHNPGQPIESLLARNKPPIHTNDQRHDSKATRTGRHNPIIAGNAFQGHPGHGMRTFPVVAETRLLQHSNEFIVIQPSGSSGSYVRKRRQIVLTIRSRNFIARVNSSFSEVVRVAIDSRNLNPNRLEIVAIQRAIHDIALE